MNKASVKTDGFMSSNSAQKSAKGLRLKAVLASLFLVAGSVIGATVVAAPADATTVFNRMLCEPDTGWCFQTNPPHNPAVGHMCYWDYKLNGNNLYSGMYYTGCDYWGLDIH